MDRWQLLIDSICWRQPSARPQPIDSQSLPAEQALAIAGNQTGVVGSARHSLRKHEQFKIICGRSFHPGVPNFPEELL